MNREEFGTAALNWSGSWVCCICFVLGMAATLYAFVFGIRWGVLAKQLFG